MYNNLTKAKQNIKNLYAYLMNYTICTVDGIINKEKTMLNILQIHIFRANIFRMKNISKLPIQPCNIWQVKD